MESGLELSDRWKRDLSELLLVSGVLLFVRIFHLVDYGTS